MESRRASRGRGTVDIRSICRVLTAERRLPYALAPEKRTVFRTVCLKGRELEQLRGGSRLTLVEGGQSM